MPGEVRKITIYQEGEHYYVMHRRKGKVWLSRELAKILLDCD